MNRIPLIAAAIAVIALVLAGYLALSSRIARLEEAAQTLPARAATPVDEFALLGYEGGGELRMRLSRRVGSAPEAAPPAVAPQAAASVPATHGGPSGAELQAALRALLVAGSDAALARLGRPGGYGDDPAVAIALPQRVEGMRVVLDEVGMGGMVDDLRVLVNRAAEMAMPDARAAVLAAIADLPLEDTSRLQPREDAASVFLRSRMTGRLNRELRPLVDRRLGELGAHALYAQALGIYRSMPFAPAIEGDLAGYVTARGVDGFFSTLRAEERQIRGGRGLPTTVALREGAARSAQ
jgi:hypothetical protein